MAEILPTRHGVMPRAPTDEQPTSTGPDDHVLSTPGLDPCRDSARRMCRLVDTKGDAIASAWGHAIWSDQPMIVDGQVVTHLVTIPGSVDPHRAVARIIYGDATYLVVSSAPAETRGFTVYRCIAASA